ncbi:M23 family metallopeptidase [Sediminitomix flava]|uniref:Murein DD-endopeptidase MepM/ murein hydrolase activator NlpD n=1 Tax=Sediminitomix flava TaxID=379075 RepID=A0A315ZIV7_SEDFL|nr:M23 family metallopeptidase [Sediminitomix flava]PWJ45020.1 murein DD-endopeptidase MepM/ murein hydrolase activator NlpD [Sediminitomix flava]
MEPKKTLSEWLSTKFILLVRDAENFKEQGLYNFTYAKIIALIGGLFILMFALSFTLASTLLAKWFDPEYSYKETDRQLLNLEEQVDSLALALNAKDLYINNIKNIINGEVEEKEEIDLTPETNTKEDINLADITPVDQAFRQEFESSDEDPITDKYDIDVHNILFYPPTHGLISQKFNPAEEHLGIDIVAKKDEPIAAVADGTIILASWTQDSGYVIGIQHKNNVISFYKHNSVLYKQVGDFVRVGDIIAIIGNSGELTSGPHLHFELWVEGSPVNPENFIVF